MEIEIDGHVFDAEFKLTDESFDHAFGTERGRSIVLTKVVMVADWLEIKDLDVSRLITGELRNRITREIERRLASDGLF